MIVCLMLSTQVINAKSLFSEYKTPLLSVEGRYATIKDSDEISLGSSGIIMHSFDESTSTIIARVDVVEKKGGIAKLRFDVYKMSAQSAFPIPGVLPQVGDIATLNYLYNRALIVAPNQSIYKEVTEHFKDIQWVHPDITAAYLAKNFIPTPDRETFQEICKANSASLIFFALDYNGYFVDCHSFQAIKQYKGAKISQFQLPFYTRVKDIEGSWFNWKNGSWFNWDSPLEDLPVKFDTSNFKWSSDSLVIKRIYGPQEDAEQKKDDALSTFTINYQKLIRY